MHFCPSCCQFSELSSPCLVNACHKLQEKEVITAPHSYFTPIVMKCVRHPLWQLRELRYEQVKWLVVSKVVQKYKHQGLHKLKILSLILFWGKLLNLHCHQFPHLLVREPSITFGFLKAEVNGILCFWPNTWYREQLGLSIQKSSHGKTQVARFQFYELPMRYLNSR